MLYTHDELDRLSFPNGITTVGVELEGYWAHEGLAGENTRPEDCDECYYDHDYGEWVRCEDCNEETYDGYTLRRARRELGLKSDGSVTLPRDLQGTHVSGEAASEILRSWPEVMEFVLAHYPSIVDWKCGLHIHMGCTRDQWSFAFDPLYWNLLIASLTRIGEGCSPQTRQWLDKRLTEGRSTEEADVYCAPNQRGDTYGRYWAVNYQSFESHGTLEVRVNPMAVGNGSGSLKAPAHTRRHPYRPAIQALNLIYATLTSTGTFWTNPALWREETARAVAEEGFELRSTLAPPVHAHVQVTV
jgi:hypothetical protein